MSQSDRSFFRRKIFFTFKNLSMNNFEKIANQKFKISIPAFGDELEFKFHHHVRWLGEADHGLGVLISSELPENLRKYKFMANFFIFRSDNQLAYCSTADTSYINLRSKGVNGRWRPLVQLAELFHPGNFLIQDKTLRIYIKVQITKDFAKHQPKPSKVLKNYENLVNNPRFSDFKFICSDDNTIFAHKCILMSFSNDNDDSSQFFRSMIDSKMLESQSGEMKIDDISSHIMLELLRYIYAEKVNDISTVAFDLLIAADKYDIVGLKELCLEHLESNLNNQNFADVLELAYTLKIVNLKDNCIDYIKLNFGKVNKTPQFEAIGKDILQDVTASMNYEPVNLNVECDLDNEAYLPPPKKRSVSFRSLVNHHCL